MREFNRLAEKHPEFENQRLPIAQLLQEHFSGGEKLRIRKSVAEGIIANYQAGWEDIRQQYTQGTDMPRGSATSQQSVMPLRTPAQERATMYRSAQVVNTAQAMAVNRLALSLRHPRERRSRQLAGCQDRSARRHSGADRESCCPWPPGFRTSSRG